MVKIINLSRGRERNVDTIEATFSKDGELLPFRVSRDDRPDTFSEIEKLLADDNVDIVNAAETLFNLMSPKAKVQSQIDSSYYLSSSLSIRGGHIFFGEERLEDTLASHMMSLLDEENTPKDEGLWRSYVKFLDNLHQNANKDIRQQLFRWMEYENRAGHGFGITDDGCLVGYKGCEGTILEPMSVFSGNAIVDGVEFTNSKIPNKPGSVVQMPRSSVTADPSIGCSYGLHVGTRDYAAQWAPILLLVKVNPRDVVSVPYECDSQKMRVCEYTVLEATDIEDEHRMYHPTIYEDDGVLTVDEAYDLLGSDVEVEYGDANTSRGILIDAYREGETAFISVKEEDGYIREIVLNDVTYFSSVIEKDNSVSYDDYELTIDDAHDLHDSNDEISVTYDGKNFVGRVVDVYNPHALSQPGVIMKDDFGEYKHIKLYRIEDWNFTGKCEDCDCDGNQCSQDNSDTQDYNLDEYEALYNLETSDEVVIVYRDSEGEISTVYGDVIRSDKNDMKVLILTQQGTTTIHYTDVITLEVI